MTNALLITFGFLELVIRAVIVMLLVVSIIGLLLLPLDEGLEDFLKPRLWEKIHG